MEHLGNFALMLAVVLAIFGTIASLLAALKARERFRVAAVRAYLGSTLMVFLAVCCLGWLLQNDAFGIVYVHNHSNVALPWYFKLTAIWGGSQGSLMWWTFILLVYTCFFLALTKKVPKLMQSWALFIIGLNIVFFLLINNVVSPPFSMWAQNPPGVDPIPFFPPDGRGLNPQLQHWAMIIHPPMLYTGYIGFLFPFALALGALITRVEGREWIRMIRRWTLTAWVILGAGIILGGAWAYMELGWGGYWAWDPVENASFMPWLLATAFIHSVMAQEQRGMFKLWNILLLLGSYLMCLFGTFITRSGLISSVHAFAESDIGNWFIGFIVVLTVLSAIILVLRHDQLRDDNKYDQFISREVGLLFNNVLFLVICFTMLLATIYPMITEAMGEKRELRHGFYNTVEVPIFLALLFLMAFGPIITWKRTTQRLLRERFVMPAIMAFVTFAICFFALDLHIFTINEIIKVALLGSVLNPVLSFVSQDFGMASISFSVLTFLLFTIIHEFAEVVSRRAKRAGEGIATAFISVISLNKRRYGGFIAHFSVLLMAIGITGAAWNAQDKKELGVGETMTVAGFTFQVESIDIKNTDNYQALVSKVNLIEDGEVTRTFFPEQRFYKASESQASEIGIDVTLARDYYVVLAGAGEGSMPEHPIGVYHIYVNPLVLWIWIGGVLMVFATFFCMMPDRARVTVRDEKSAAVGEPA